MKKLLLIGSLCIAIIAGFSGCTKSSDSNPAAIFVGTWKGTSTCSSSQVTLTLTAGSTNSTVVNTGSVGTAGTSCYKAVSLTGNVNGNTVTFPATTLTDNCGNSYTITMSGVLNGTTLTYTEIVSGSVSANCTATVTKQ